MKLNRVGNIERLIVDLRAGDLTQRSREHYQAKYTVFLKSLDAYYDSSTNDRWRNALKAMADLIEEAMEGQDESD